MTDHHKTNIMTLTRYVLEQQRAYPEATGDLSIALNAVQVGCKFVESCVRKARLINLVGLAHNTNVQGEEQKKLDVLSNEMFVNALTACGKISFMVSEEVDKIILTPDGCRGKYCITFDPLDGSSNIDAGVNVGTIFGIWKLPAGPNAKEENILVKGSTILAAGYCMYGSSCNMVITLGNNNVQGFTLDPALGEFILTHPDIKIPSRGNIYSVNEGYSMYWDDATSKYIDSLKFPKEAGKKPYNSRYVGSMVADVHRTLLYGGIFAYPSNKKSRDGKLRVLYESFPMAYIVEQAGGKATTGLERVLDLIPKHIHDRCPIFLGSKEDIEDAERFFKKYNNWLNGSQKE